jgi:hypothetical protein
MSGLGARVIFSGAILIKPVGGISVLKACKQRDNEKYNQCGHQNCIDVDSAFNLLFSAVSEDQKKDGYEN